MAAPKDPTLTYKLLAKSLGVTVTTVKSYRRKFPEFWRTASLGKPIRFPVEALDLCRRIQHHFKRGLSVEETRSRLAEEFEPLVPPPPERQDAPVQDPGPLARMEGLLEGLFSLQNRTHSLLAELVVKLDTLADRLGPSSPAAAPANRTPSGGEASRAAESRPTPSGPLPKAAPSPAPSAHRLFPDGSLPGITRQAVPEEAVSASGERPPQALLDMPVVVRSGSGEFLGVTLKSGRPFTLARLEAFLAERTRSASAWTRQGEEWTLRLESDGRDLDHRFHQAVTPRGNSVALFASLSLAGDEAPEAELQALLRQVKETIDQ